MAERRGVGLLNWSILGEMGRSGGGGRVGLYGPYFRGTGLLHSIIVNEATSYDSSRVCVSGIGVNEHC